KLVLKTTDSLIIDVGGVGYEVNAPLSTFYAVPEEGADISLLIYTHVKEDAIKLFGFLTDMEKKLFIKLISVSGVGPKLAMNILSGMESSQLAIAIKESDIPRMNAIPGVGKKTAERLILELKDKIDSDILIDGASQAMPEQKKTTVFDDALSALLNLGYRKPDVEKTLDSLIQSDNTLSVESLLKEALKLMAK
ncbi:MAG: Holliday junction branch migration protein RuvA, partial [Desulfobulbaceae bacterium]|nr:Holliday junction branch migration protein RuvA [Desulfobulbaceae bacterium]